jgi:hypothetical protein
LPYPPRAASAGHDLDHGDLGGGIEVFPTAAGAKARADYIQSVRTGGAFLGTEWDYRIGDGRTLLRISGEMTSKQAKQYRDVAAKLAG